MKALTGPGLTGARLAPRWRTSENSPHRDLLTLAGVIVVACFLTSLFLVTLAFWDYGGWTSYLIGLTLAFIIGVFALIAWAFVCELLDGGF